MYKEFHNHLVLNKDDLLAEVNSPAKRSDVKLSFNNNYYEYLNYNGDYGIIDLNSLEEFIVPRRILLIVGYKGLLSNSFNEHSSTEYDSEYLSLHALFKVSRMMGRVNSSRIMNTLKTILHNPIDWIRESIWNDLGISVGYVEYSNPLTYKYDYL